jgi:CheY-like chemotaxis protein
MERQKDPSMNRRILCVDDEINVLKSLEQILHKRFEVDIAVGGAEALNLLRESPTYAVIVSDMRMPLMSGVELLVRVKRQYPDTVRLLLTGQSDMNDAMAAVNRGGIFRFLGKPCPPETIIESIDAAIEQHSLVTAEKQLLKETLSGVVKVLTDLLAITSPRVFNRAARLRSVVERMTEVCEERHDWRFELAAQLALIGCIALPPELVERVLSGVPVTVQERRMFARHPETGRNLIGKVPRLEVVAEIVGHQLDRDLSAVADADTRRGIELLQSALAVDERVANGELMNEAIRQMCRTIPPKGEAVLAKAAALEVTKQATERAVRVSELEVGMLLDCDVRTRAGHLILTRGRTLSSFDLELLSNFAESVGIVEPVNVRTPSHKSES